jgi:hypothetical protein
MEPACVPVRPESLNRVLKAIAHKTAGSQHQVCADHLLEHFNVLLQFLATDRFRGDPRQIANALAGVPSISFWRSLKVGQTEPCLNRIGQRALKAYIRRKHPRLYSDLETRINLVHFINVHRAYRTKDETIRDHYANAIHSAWIEARPKVSPLLAHIEGRANKRKDPFGSAK